MREKGYKKLDEGEIIRKIIEDEKKSVRVTTSHLYRNQLVVISVYIQLLFSVYLSSSGSLCASKSGTKSPFFFEREKKEKKKKKERK